MITRVSRRLVSAALAAMLAFGAADCARRDEPITLPPAVVMSPYHLSGIVVRGASQGWWKLASGPARFGEPLPVKVTMYCLTGKTRRGRYVRSGIVAADPKFFPLSRYIELYIGRSYLGRFLVDDTGKRIKGERIDVWTASCREARRFGIQRGTAVRVERGAPAVQLAGEPGR